MFSHRIRNLMESHLGIWQVPLLAHYPNFLATGILLLASIFISCGARVSSLLTHTFSAISLGVIFFTTVLGFTLARPQNWSTQEGGFAPFSFSGILASTATCFYAFVGFDVNATSSEEARNLRRAVPMAVTILLGMVSTVYILVSTVLTLMVPWHSLDPDSALADTFYRHGYSWAGFIMAAGSICSEGQARGRWGRRWGGQGRHTPALPWALTLEISQPATCPPRALGSSHWILPGSPFLGGR